MVLDQISFVNNQNKINNFDYSNRERQTEFGLNLMALGARMYDPTIARFWSVDPLIEIGQQSFTPYHYSFNNPIRFNDPDGLMGEDCCQKVIDFFAGAVLTFIDNNSPVPTNLDGGGYRGSAYEAGRKVGSYASIASGAIQTVGGAIGAFGSGVVEVVTVGVASPVALPVRAAAVATTANGLATLSKAINNLKAQGTNKGGEGNSVVKSNPYSKIPDKQLASSKSSYEKLIKEHKEKLADFKSDPMSKSDPNKLKEAMKGGKEAVKKFLQGRIESLNKQIKKQEGELLKINEEIKNRNL